MEILEMEIIKLKKIEEVIAETEANINRKKIVEN